MKNLIALSLCILSISLSGQVKYDCYSKAEIEQDLDFAFGKLTNIHPIFLDSTQLNQWQDKYSSIKSSLKDSMTQNECYLILASLFASLNDGHTGVVMPYDQRVQYSNAGGKAFPFFVDIENNSMYVSFYCGNDSTLLKGGEQILEINSIEVTTMVHEMQKLYGGNSVVNKNHEIADKFRFLIWMLYGFENDYEILIKNNQNNIQKIPVPGITSIEFKENLKRKPKEIDKQFDVSINNQNKTAILKIKSFGDLDGFCAFANKAFADINENNIENLVIDIRNNSGGRSIVVDSLMNYITGKEYAQYKKIEMRVSKELKEWYEKRYPERLNWINGFANDELVISEQEPIQPKNNNLTFKGNLYLLTNKTSFSAAATFAGVFKELKLGTIIGEETGGTIAYYGDYWFLTTPNTGIKFHVAPKRFIQYGGTLHNRGVIPNNIVSDIGDSIINFTYGLIEKQ